MKPLEMSPALERDDRILSFCEPHLEHATAVLADLLLSLEQIRAAYLQGDLSCLGSLSVRQYQLLQANKELAEDREELCDSLAPLLGVAPAEVSLRAAALTLSDPARSRLLRKRDELCKMARQAEQLTQHNAALLSASRDFLNHLFANLTGAGVSQGYGPGGQRHRNSCGPFLQAWV
jgi:hypothetical protein